MEPTINNSCIKKRKALEMETEDKLGRSLTKRVSFGLDSVIEIKVNDQAKDISEFLLETENKIEQEKKQIFSILTQPSKAAQVIDSDMLSLKQDLRLCALIDQEHLNQVRAKLESDMKIIEKLELLKENTMKNCQNSVNLAFKQWESARIQRKESKQKLKELKTLFKKSKRIKECYKDLSNLFGVKFKHSDYSKTVEINDFSFKLEKNKSEFAVRQLAGPEKMLMDGKNRLHKEELGTFFFRVLDR